VKNEENTIDRAARPTHAPKTSDLRRCAGALACLWLLGTHVADAQSGAATLTGVVTSGRDEDRNVAAQAGVLVSATHIDTGASYTGWTTEAGAFTIVGLPLGAYSLTAQQSGFKTAQAVVTLAASQIARVDFRLEIGSLNVTVDVAAPATRLQTESAVVGGRTTEIELAALPSNGRNPVLATLFTSGAVSPHTSSFNELKNTAGGRPYVNGQREQGNNFTLDGVDINDAIDNFVAYQPNPDALREIRTETLNYSPELGNVAGAVVNMVLKSGTNTFNGNGVYDWLDNDLAATAWETNRVGGHKPDFRRTFVGATFGGPIVKNRWFVFADYQGGRQQAPSTAAFRTVAPDPWRAGDLSSLLPRNIVIRDPATGDPFPGNVIPISRFGPFARALFADTSLYPRPSILRPLSDFGANYQGMVASSAETNHFDVKLDWNASSTDKVWARYSFQNHDARTDQTAIPMVFGTNSSNPYRGAAANWNRTLGRSFVSEALIGYNDNAYEETPTDLRGLGALNAAFGIAGTQPVAGLSEVRPGNGVQVIGTRAIITRTRNRVLQLNERLVWFEGKHTVKLGVRWDHYRMRRYFSGENGVLGQFAYDGSFTGAPFGDFLLDLVSLKGRGLLAEPWTQLQHRVALYAEDDLRATDRLTVNLGLRWAYSSPLVEESDRQVNFDLRNAQPLFAGREGNSRALYHAFYGGWEPRLGLAYRPTEYWVLRGGYGISQSMEGTGANLRLTLNPPFFFESEARYDRTSGPGTVTTGFEGLQALDAVSGQVRAWDPDLRPQFTQQWNVSMEFQIGSAASVTAGYVGSSSTHLVTPVDGNQPLPGEGDPLTWAPLQKRRPLNAFNPLITSVSTTTSAGRAKYNGLQTVFHGRVGRQVSVLANYTLSRAMTNNVGYYGSVGVAAPESYPMTSYDIARDYGPAFFDATHVFTALATYEPSLDTARFWRTLPGRAARHVLRGFTFTAAVTAHSGFPITVTDGSNPSLQGSRGTERPNRVGSGQVGNPTVDHWLDRAAFESAPLGQFGDAGVGILRAPAYRNIDLSVGRRIALPKRHQLFLLAEAFNALNIPSFGPPVADIQSQNFGAIFTTVNAPRTIHLVAKYSF
jgi:outer membrane receptor protein involved in Fe transport